MKRDQFIKFRVSESEKKIITDHAKNYAVPVSVFLRGIGVHGGSFKYLTKEEATLLRKSLNNLNQYMRFMHTHNIHVPEAEALITDIKNILKKNTFQSYK